MWIYDLFLTADVQTRYLSKFKIKIRVHVYQYRYIVSINMYVSLCQKNVSSKS